jgi:DNA replication protein DnaC
MLYNLHISKADNSYYKKLSYYTQPNLLILDELGFAPIQNHSVHDFFEVISKRYEKSSTIITTNKSLDHWNEILSDEILTNAIQDRIVHHSTIFRLSGQSYRSRGIKK